MSTDYAFWKWRGRARISRGLCYLLVAEGAELPEVELLDVDRYRELIAKRFPTVAIAEVNASPTAWRRTYSRPLSGTNAHSSKTSSSLHSLSASFTQPLAAFHQTKRKPSPVFRVALANGHQDARRELRRLGALPPLPPRSDA
jgi:hypothetical protein